MHTFENVGSSEARFLEVAAPGAFAGYFGKLLAAVPPTTIAALYEKYDIVPVGTQQDHLFQVRILIRHSRLVPF